MALKLKIDVEGVPVMDLNFRRAAESIEDLSGAFRAVQKAFFEIEQDQFQSEGAKGASGKWKPLSPAYEKQKVARYGTFALLAGVEIASEKLYKSLTGKTSDSVEFIDKKEAAFGTGLPYAKAQHFGYSPRNLPSRPLIDLSDEQKKGLGKIISKNILGEIRRRTTLIVKDTEAGDLF